MKMNPEALKAVLRALQKNCLDDMADDKSSPDEKMADAMEDSGDEYAEDDEDTEPETEIAMEDPGDEQEEDEATKLRNFFKTPKAKPPRPGTAVMLAIDENPKKKKSIRDLMHG